MLWHHLNWAVFIVAKRLTLGEHFGRITQAWVALRLSV